MKDIIDVNALTSGYSIVLIKHKRNSYGVEVWKDGELIKDSRELAYIEAKHKYIDRIAEYSL